MKVKQYWPVILQMGYLIFGYIITFDPLTLLPTVLDDRQSQFKGFYSGRNIGVMHLSVCKS